MKNKILFRADADQQIGYGHFIRTLALADMLKDYFECVFYLQTPSDYQKKELSKVCDFVELPVDDSKFDLFLDYLCGDEIVVLDNYYYTCEYETQIRKKGCKVVLIDNIHRRHTCADAVIGFLIGLTPEVFSVEPYTKLYLGTGYTLLRRPFLERLKTKHKPISDFSNLNVVISFGGADPQGVAVSMANLLETSDKVNSITVIGNHTDGLKHCDKIISLSNLSAEEMCDAFASNDLAILPASTTMLEALACGIKIIGGYFVDNQIDNYSQYVKSKSIIGCDNLTNPENQKRIRTIIDKGIDITELNTEDFIPSNVKDNILSIFQSL